MHPTAISILTLTRKQADTQAISWPSLLPYLSTETVIVGEPFLGGIDNQDNYDQLLEQINAVVAADSSNK